MNRAPNVFELHLLELIARGGYDANDPPIASALFYARTHADEAAALLALTSLHTALTGPVASIGGASPKPEARRAPKARTGRPRPAQADSPEQRRVRQALADTQGAAERARLDARNQARKDARKAARQQRIASVDHLRAERAKAAEPEVQPDLAVAEEVQA